MKTILDLAIASIPGQQLHDGLAFPVAIAWTGPGARLAEVVDSIAARRGERLK